MSCPLAGVLVVILFAGCGEKRAERFPVSGAVTLDGKPLPNGYISFDPTDGKGTAFGTEITDGKYSIECEVGPKLVSVRASRPSKKPGPDGGPDFEQYLPARYNTKSKLTAQVDAKEMNTIDFEVSAK